jgi:hypothetical protein
VGSKEVEVGKVELEVEADVEVRQKFERMGGSQNGRLT